MKNLMKKLAVGVLSLTLLTNGLKAQPQLSKEDSIILNNYDKGYDFNYPIEFSQEKVKSSVFEDPSLYGGIVIGGATLFNIGYARNHFALEERKSLIKTATYVYLAGAAISVGAYLISEKIIENKKKRQRLERKYLNY